MKTLQSMVFIASVLLTTIVNAQTSDFDKAKARITELLQGQFEVYENQAKDAGTGNDKPTFNTLGSPTNVLVLDDRIELSYKKDFKTIYFTSKLVKEYPRTLILGNFLFMQSNNKRYGSREYKETEKENSENGKDEHFYQYMRILCNKSSEVLIAEFKPIAEKYRALTIKPAVSEEQRKLIVQANAANEQKNYSRAIERYHQAIQLDPTAYPAAYYNIALLSAQIHNFNDAILNMKKYLMLVPDAEDARGAQDKIYEWEDRIFQ